MQKTLPLLIAVALVVGGAAFYGGMQFEQSRTPRGSTPANFQNLSPEQRQARLQQMGMPGGADGRGGRFGNRNAGDFAAGEIIAKDDQSVTVKLRDARLPDGQGGSKIIFYAETTEVGKFVSGTPDDLEVGKTVMVNGKANADGSLTAESIQIRPPGTGVPPRSGPPSSDVSP